MTPEMSNESSSTSRPRGAVRKEDSVMVTVWIPKPLLAAIDAAVATQDTDRSKFVRTAVRRELGK